MQKQTKYVAFLRGINVGGNTMVKMYELRKVFESLGFKNVLTLLNSGNVIFEATDTTAEIIEEQLKQALGFTIVVILQTLEQIQSLVKKNLFKNIKINPNARLHVTFLKHEFQSSLKLPYVSEDFKILGIFQSAICSVVELSETAGTTELMKLIEKEFGRNVTTRIWNTVVKLSNL